MAANPFRDWETGVRHVCARGLIHLLANMYALAYGGNTWSPCWEKGRFVPRLFLPVSQPASPVFGGTIHRFRSVGASGAIF